MKALNYSGHCPACARGFLNKTTLEKLGRDAALREAEQVHAEYLRAARLHGLRTAEAVEERRRMEGGAK